MRKRLIRRHYLYLIRSLKVVKIGISHYPLARFDGITTAERAAGNYGGCIDLLACVALPNAYIIEQTLHKRYAAQRLHGEWFKLTDEQLLDLLETFYKLAKKPILDSVLMP